MSEQLIQALQNAKSPEWAVRVDQWMPDGVDGTYYRMIDGPRMTVPMGGQLSLVVLPQIYQNTQTSESSGLTLSQEDGDSVEALVDHLTAAQARALAVSLVNAAAMLDQWAETSA